MSGVVVHGPTLCGIDIPYTTLLHSIRPEFDSLHQISPACCNRLAVDCGEPITELIENDQLK